MALTAVMTRKSLRFQLLALRWRSYKVLYNSCSFGLESLHRPPQAIFIFTKTQSKI